MNGECISIVHLSDLHFGGPADIAQVEEMEALIPRLSPHAIAISGDVTQRARHGEFQRARALVRQMERVAPTLIVPGNHDVRWWASPFGIRGQAVKYEKYRRYFGRDLTPMLTIPGAVLVGALTAYGISFGSLTPNLNDLAVKGHLPRRETDRVRRMLESAAPGAVRVVVLHHNVLRGEHSQRMGLAHWRSAQQRLVAAGAEVILCGHDHQEGAGQIDGRVVVSTCGTPTTRTRGGRASVFNVVRIQSDRVQVEHYRWEAGGRMFHRSDVAAFARVPYSYDSPP